MRKGLIKMRNISPLDKSTDIMIKRLAELLAFSEYGEDLFSKFVVRMCFTLMQNKGKNNLVIKSYGETIKGNKFEMKLIAKIKKNHKKMKNY